MYIAYSALQSLNQQQTNNQAAPETELQLRYRAYHATCEKYRREITDIQKFIPNWQPKFY